MRPCNYFYSVSGDEAETLLNKYGEEGEFLARPSESEPNNYTLSIHRGVGVPITHIKIHNVDNMLCLVGESFNSLAEVIHFCIDNPTQLREKDGNTIIIRRPVCIPLHETAARDSRGPTAERWFHANITGQEAKDALLKEKSVKQWTYLVRDSARSPGHYVISVKTGDGVVNHIMIERSETGMYHVRGGDEFRTIGDLLGHYNHNPMVVVDSQNVVHLRAMVPSSCIPADVIESRFRQLDVMDSTTKRDGFAEEFSKIQTQDDQMFSRREGKKEVNVRKNRYKNIVPYDHTRVILKELKEGQTDYINANFIRIPESNPLGLTGEKEYISTQGCLPHTVEDFIQMIWQCNSRVIVMTTKEVERGKVKCYRYWPEYQADPRQIGPFTIKCTSENIIQDHEEDSYTERTLSISCRGETRSIAHLQFVGWPDHGCPDSPDSVLRFLECADNASEAVKHLNVGPPVVHCSAGIGRTGTFIVIDVLLNHIKKYGISCTIDVPRTVLLIREQRSGMVQTDQQYRFIYRALMTYILSSKQWIPPPVYDDCLLPLAPPPVPRRNNRPDQVRSYVNSNPVPLSPNGMLPDFNGLKLHPST